MLGLRTVGGALLAGFVLLNCGRSETGAAPSATDGDAPFGGAASDADACGGAGPEGGCTSAGGEPALEAYARLHTACNLRVRVNRRGGPVCIDYHLK